MTWMRYVFDRAGWLFLLVALALYYGTDHKSVQRSAQLQALSRLTPNFNYYEKFVSGSDEALDRKALEECVVYHKYVASLVPSSAGEALSMVGYCSYRAGKKSQAVQAFRQAAEKVPVFFWNDYNLGVVSFNEGDFVSAVDSFQKALGQDPRHTLFLLTHSKVFTDIRQKFLPGQYNVEAGLKLGYERAAMLIKLAAMCRENPQAPPCLKRGLVPVQFF